MIDEQTEKRIKNMETVIVSLSRRLAVLEGKPQISPEEANAKALAAQEERMSAIPRAFWKEPISE